MKIRRCETNRSIPFRRGAKPRAMRKSSSESSTRFGQPQKDKKAANPPFAAGHLVRRPAGRARRIADLALGRASRGTNRTAASVHRVGSRAIPQPEAFRGQDTCSKYVSSVDRQAGACHGDGVLTRKIGDHASDLTLLGNARPRATPREKESQILLETQIMPDNAHVLCATMTSKRSSRTVRAGLSERRGALTRNGSEAPLARIVAECAVRSRE